MSTIPDNMLIEMTAKAIGLTIHPLWNPLTQPIQAFKLACKLGIQMMPYPETKPPLASASLPNGVSMEYFGEIAVDQSMEQAMCRAITRAAAHYQLLKEKQQ